MNQFKLNAEQLIDLRKRAGLSVAEAARCCQVSARSWTRFEAGERIIPRGLVELFRIKTGVED